MAAHTRKRKTRARVGMQEHRRNVTAVENAERRLPAVGIPPSEKPAPLLKLAASGSCHEARRRRDSKRSHSALVSGTRMAGLAVVEVGGSGDGLAVEIDDMGADVVLDGCGFEGSEGASKGSLDL